MIVRRFLSIFYPPTVYQKVAIVTKMKEESFFSSFKVLAEEGYLKVAGVPGKKSDGEDTDAAFFIKIQGLKKGHDTSGAVFGHQRGQDLTTEALQFRFADPCDGKCRTAD